jgi:predicted deacetylase
VRLQKGLSTLAQLRYSPSGFIAPGWMTSPAAVQAVTEIGFDYLTSHFHVRDLVVGTQHFAPVVCQRPGSWSSGVIAHATKYLAGFLRSVNLPLRVAVHPDDLHDSRLRNTILHIVDQAIADGYQSVTYERFISNSRYSHDAAPFHQLESFV